MSTYKYDSIVSRQEAEALKEMIFKRARERAESLNAETQRSYTENVQNDVMDLARATFAAEKNPFSQNKVEPEPVQETELGFPKRQIKETNGQIGNANYHAQQTFVKNQIESTMLSARGDFTQKSTFMGALNFLNTQASIALVKNRSTKFEAVA